MALLIAFVVGTGVALLPYYVADCSLAIDGRLTPFLNSFPGIGWTLLAIIWLGLGLRTVIFAVAIILVPFMIINIREGVRTVDQELIEMAEELRRQPLARIPSHRAALAFPLHVLGDTRELRRRLESGADSRTVRRNARPRLHHECCPAGAGDGRRSTR